MKKEQTLEQAMSRLEEIVGQLSNGGLPLDESLRLFEEGTGLVRGCDEKMKDANLKVEVLKKSLQAKQCEEGTTNE